MRFRSTQIVAAAVLFVCLVCPVLEMFDHWDKTEQTGNDTEYTFVVLGLCVGVGYAFARFIFQVAARPRTRDDVFAKTAPRPPARGGSASFFVIPIPLSPPILSLRI
jgi:hypothetical protein